MKMMIVVVWVSLAAPVAAQVELRSSLKDLEAAVRRDSNDAQLHYELGVELARNGRTAEARRALRNAVSIDPKLSGAWVGLIRLDPTHGRPMLTIRKGPDGRLHLVVLPPSDSIRYMYRRAFLLNPLVDISSAGRYPLPSGWERSMSRAMQAFRAAQWAEAAQSFGKVIAQTTRRGKPDVSPAFALWYHALAQVELGHLDSAVQDVERLLNAAFRDSTPYGQSEAFSHQYTLAYLHHVAGNLDEASRIYRMLLEDQLGLDLVHLRLAQVLETQGRWDDAVAERRNAANANPDDPSLVFDLGVTLHNAGYNAEAEGVLERALVANPREVRAHLILGAARQALGKADAARQAYTRFVEIAPSRHATLVAEARRRLLALGPP